MTKEGKAMRNKAEDKKEGERGKQGENQRKKLNNEKTRKKELMKILSNRK